MIVTSTKRKIIITRFEVKKLERFKPFEIRLPANVKKLTGILVTASGSKASGTISFQANDRMDVFHVAQVFENGIEPSDEALFNVEDSQFGSDKVWVTGNVPKLRAINVEGDTTIVNGWFKGKTFDQPFTVRVYVECELVEELEKVRADGKKREDGSDNSSSAPSIYDPIEIHL
ncbi:MAG: hypothetical protein ACOYXT_18330 [Bacteroidota bacterium]